MDDDDNPFESPKAPDYQMRGRSILWTLAAFVTAYIVFSVVVGVYRALVWR